VTQSYGPLIVAHAPCVSQASFPSEAAVDSRGGVVSGGSHVIDCALYTKVWRNHTLIANSARHGYPSCYPGPRYLSVWTFPPGTRVTVQNWLDVKFRDASGGVVTHRFQSLRGAITTR
jgi:hypothetical protein